MNQYTGPWVEGVRNTAGRNLPGNFTEPTDTNCYNSFPDLDKDSDNDGNPDLKIDALLKNNILATEEDFLWVSMGKHSILGISENKILDDICSCLLEGSYSTGQLASKINILFLADFVSNNY